MYLGCLRALRVSRVYLLTCLCFVRAFIFLRALIFVYMSYVLSDFYVPYVPSFLTCLTCLHFVTCLIAFIFYVPSFFYVLTFYLLIKLTQINEHLPMFIKYFHSYKFCVVFCMIFSFFETKNINHF